MLLCCPLSFVGMMFCLLFIAICYPYCCKVLVALYCCATSHPFIDVLSCLPQCCCVVPPALPCSYVAELSWLFHDAVLQCWCLTYLVQPFFDHHFVNAASIVVLLLFRLEVAATRVLELDCGVPGTSTHQRHSSQQDTGIDVCHLRSLQ